MELLQIDQNKASISVKPETRFVHLSPEEVADLQQKKTSKNTNRATSNAVKTFLSFCQEGNILSINVIPPEELDSVLARFYAGARTEQGELYKANTMNSLRNGLQRHFIQARGVDIINDVIFNASNTCFKNVLAAVKKTVKGKTEHHAEIEPEDLAKLYESIDVWTPTGLQEKVWVDIMRFFIRRGVENLRDMTKNTFGTGTDASGKKFIYQMTDEYDKNHGDGSGSSDTNGEGRMYETGTKDCPVLSYLTYVTKLHPELDALWQRPKAMEQINTNTWTWYVKSPCGEKYLSKMMGKMSVKYGLSQRYTNHCLRVTSIQALEDAGIEGRHIVRISGHKNEESIKHYTRRLSAARKQNISSIIAGPTPSTEKKMKDEEIDFKRETVSVDAVLPSAPLQALAQNHKNEQVASSVSNSPLPVSFDMKFDDDEIFSAIPDEDLQVPQVPGKMPSFMRHLGPVFYNCKVKVYYNKK